MFVNGISSNAKISPSFINKRQVAGRAALDQKIYKLTRDFPCAIILIIIPVRRTQNKQAAVIN
jgi:hypothetical protein